MRQKENDERLEEVKAILHRLQQIRAEPEPSSAEAPVLPQASPRFSWPPVRKVPRPVLLMAGGGLLAAGSLAAIGLILLLPSAEPSPKAAAIPTNTATGAAPPLKENARETLGQVHRDLANTGDAVSLGQQLMAEGDIVAARQALRGAAEGQSADAALALARSYDPNFLKSIPRPNAGPDVAEAERWYRKWYELAAKDGLVMDNARLERIISSMR